MTLNAFWPIVILVFLFSLQPSGLAEDWPMWRGPNRNGISSEMRWQPIWPAGGPPIAWRTNVGTGFSSVSVVAERLYTLGNADDKDSVFCLNSKTGEVVWQHTYDCPLDDRFFEGGPTSTPTVDGDRVYTLSRQGDLFCLDASSGQIRWSKNVQQESGARIPGWGFSSSPLVHEDKLILNVGDAGLAIDKLTGKLLWKSGDGEAGYMTPHKLKIDDQWYALIASGKFYQCIAIDSGTVGWKHRWLTTNGCNAADPIVHDGNVFISSGYGRGAALLSFTDKIAKVVWSNHEMHNQMNSSVLIDGQIYGFDGDEGGGEVQLKCLEFSTGEVRWSYPGLGAGSLFAANNHLIVLSESGELVIAPVSNDSFKPTASAKILDGKCWTVPVLSHGYIYCRNASGEIACVNVNP